MFYSNSLQAAGSKASAASASLCLAPSDAFSPGEAGGKCGSAAAGRLQNRPLHLGKEAICKSLSFFLIKETSAAKSKLPHLFLLKSIRVSSQPALLPHYKLLLRVAFYLTNYTVGSELLFRSWSCFTVIGNTRSAAPGLHFSV